LATDPEIEEFLARAGWQSAHAVPLAGDASGRRYLRLTGDDKAVLMVAPAESLGSYLYVTAWLKANGFSAPEIHACDNALGLILMEDLGDALFTRLIAADPSREAELFVAATDTLVALARLSLPVNLPMMPPTYRDLAATAWEWWGESEQGAEALDLLDTHLQELGPARTFIHRDWHAGNLLWLPDRTGIAQTGIIDFQDALIGHPGYDLVSMTRDARRLVPDTLHHVMVARFATATGLPLDRFARDCALLGIQRNLRVLGIFARLALRDGKPGYLYFAPIVWRHLMADLSMPGLEPLHQQIVQTLPEPDEAALNRLKARCPTR
jgi:N-acetylmuramate 1-kinase